MVARVCCSEFSESIFRAEAGEFLFKQIISFAQQHVKKKFKKLTAKKNLNVCALTGIEDHIN